MSRSKRKTPIRGLGSAESEKTDKLASHRKVRRAVRALVAIPDVELPQERQLTNTWSMAKDGKTRFDPATKPWLMRK